MTYTPRRAAKKRLEGAPEYVLDVFDDPRYGDRYTVLFCGSVTEFGLLNLRKVFYLAMSGNPSHPLGISMWGEMDASNRPSHHRIRWLDLPEHIRKHVEMRVKQ